MSECDYSHLTSSNGLDIAYEKNTPCLWRFASLGRYSTHMSGGRVWRRSVAGSTGSDGHFLARKACEERRKRSPERGRKREDNKTGVVRL